MSEDWRIECLIWDLRAMSAVNLLSSLQEKPHDESPKDGSKYEGKCYSVYPTMYQTICQGKAPWCLDFSRYNQSRQQLFTKYPWASTIYS